MPFALAEFQRRGNLFMADATAPRQLERSLKLFDSTMIVAGSMIGSGIFLVTAQMTRDLGSTGWLLFSWVITAVLTLAAALSYGELAAMMPWAGGQYVYLREAFSPLTGFLYGWTLFLVIQTGIIDAVAIGFARYLGVLLPGISESVYVLPPVRIIGDYAVSLSSAQLIAILVIVLLTWINALGLRHGKHIQNVFTVSKLVALAGVILLGLAVGRNHAALHQNFIHPWAMQHLALASTGLAHGTRQPLLIALCLAQVGSLFAADAWNNITFTAGEVVNPRRNLALSLTIGTLLVMVMYFLTNLAFTFVLPLTQIANAPSDRVGEAMLNAIYPSHGGQIIAVVILVAAIGCINGMVLSGARTYYAMAKDGLFLPTAARLNHAHVPSSALWLQSAWAVVLLSVRVYNPETKAYGNLYSNLLDYVIAAALLFYIATIAAVFRLRSTRPEADRPYRAVGYPVLPALYIVGAATILIVLFLYRMSTTGPGLLIVALGIPVYYLFRRKLRPAAEETADGSTDSSLSITP
jgi:APA family basic amino acid/polyamine antiporter